MNGGAEWPYLVGRQSSRGYRAGADLNKQLALTGMNNIMPVRLRPVSADCLSGTNMAHQEHPFNLFLSSLSSDRDTAEKKLEDIRRRLVIMLECRGCACSEDLAHEAILRFTHRLSRMDAPFEGDAIAYLCTVAYNLFLEYASKDFLPLPEDCTEMPQPDVEAVKAKEQLHKCLDECLEQLDPDSHELALDYYRFDKQSKIDFRKALAKARGISANALRIRLLNIRASLEECIEQRLRLDPSLEME